MKTDAQHASRAGFTLTEVLVAITLSVVVLASAWNLFFNYHRSARLVALELETQHMANMALSRMVYGIGGFSGLRQASNLEVNPTINGWSISIEDFDGTPSGEIIFDAVAQSIRHFPATGGVVRIADSVALADAVIVSNRLQLTVEVEMQRGRASARRQLGSVVRWRN